MPSPSDAGTAVELSHVGKTFDGVQVLSDVHLQVEQGTVHALLGGNGSGKSTTLKILAGVYTADAGAEIAVNGSRHSAKDWSPALAKASGLRFVHQSLGLVPDLTVAENFALDGGYPRLAGAAISWRRLRRSTRASLARAQVDVDPQALVRDLRPSDKTLVAIARALRDVETGERLTLVLDEPTASLPHHEASLLIDAIRRSRELGQTIVYVSHRLSEVLSVADRVSVLRDGRVVADEPAARLDEERIVALMAGREAQRIELAARPRELGGALVRVEGLTAGPLRDVDLEVRSGEIVGIAGLLGSGRSSLLRALFADLPRERGEIQLDGRAALHRCPADAMRAGIALVPEDRAQDAAFSDRPVWENISATVVRDYWAGWRMTRGAERADATRLMADFAVRAASCDATFGTLSGGNQQKAVLARWFRLDPRLLLLDEPTQGVDAIARAEIHELVRGHVARGRAALVVSSDFEELEALCDRVVILRRGTVVAELARDELTESAIAALAHTDRRQAR